jgi:hypothetical protein
MEIFMEQQQQQEGGLGHDVQIESMRNEVEQVLADLENVARAFKSGTLQDDRGQLISNKDTVRDMIMSAANGVKFEEFSREEAEAFKRRFADIALKAGIALGRF